MIVRIVEASFDPQAELALFAKEHDGAGALASFVGYCRPDSEEGAVRAMRLDHYPEYTEREIARLAENVRHNFGCLDILVLHRVGIILPREPIVVVAALAQHRANAFDAVRILMDYLKTDAPLWKKEFCDKGDRWVEPRRLDQIMREKAEKDMARS